VATRGARNTMGKRQRQDIKGTVSDAVTSPQDDTLLWHGQFFSPGRARTSRARCPRSPGGSRPPCS
jgi:hypothetical protein